MREYPDLVTLLANKAGVANPAKAVEQLIEGNGKLHPDYEYLVPFVEPLVPDVNDWLRGTANQGQHNYSTGWITSQ